ncbi:hypothetical protein ABEF95_013662 [Exophiala dermatitidis]
MAMKMGANRPVDFALRALQIIFAIIVMGTDGHAIHVFRGHTVYEHTQFGTFDEYYGVHNAWGFLMFCAAWSLPGVIFVIVAGIMFGDHTLIGYIRVAVEVVALLSWFAGFIAVAVSIGSNACPAEEHGCGSLEAAIVFGALEWLLFTITTIQTIKLVFTSTRQPRTFPTDGPSIPI